MKIVQMVPDVATEASGPSYSVSRLCEEIGALGRDVTLTTHSSGRAIPGVTQKIFPVLPFARRFGFSFGHSQYLRRIAAKGCIIHNHGLWSGMNVTAGLMVPGRQAKLVCSPKGTLSPWALHHRKIKKTALWPLQKKVLTGADLLHATAETELEDIRRLGIKAPVVILPNGIDLLELHPREARSGRLRLLFLSRLHEIKGIENLLHAWSLLASKHHDWELIIAGIGDSKYVEKLKHQAAAMPRVVFQGPIYGSEKTKLYRSSDLFVLPSHSENFGMVVAEALSQECPAVVGKGAPWSGLSCENCGWWIENDPRSLADALQNAMSLSVKQRQTMGSNGRKWMERDFDWTKITTELLRVYDWISGRGDMPASVILD